MDQLQAVILAIVEGLTEFLPVSSTGHMILASDALGIVHTDFVKSFEIIIQLGAIMAVVALYLKLLLTNRRVWVTMIAGFLPAAIVGATAYQFVKQFLLGNVAITLLALFGGGALFLVFERLYREQENSVQKIDGLTLKQALIVGLYQCLALVPGVSRSAATIIGGLALGLNRKTAAEFSFLLAVPTMLAASGYDLYKTGFAFSRDEYLLLAIGLFGAFVTAMLAIKLFISYVQHHTFVSFGIYRIIAAGLFWLLIVR